MNIILHKATGLYQPKHMLKKEKGIKITINSIEPSEQKTNGKEQVKPINEILNEKVIKIQNYV